MATVTPVEEYIDELTKCPICLDGLTDPKSLPCLHTFCLKCIQGYCRDSSSGDQEDCPVCRSPFVIPHPGVEHLTSNFFINGLVEVNRASGGRADKVLCDVCCKFDDIEISTVPAATVYCTGCGQKLCVRCSRPHQMIPGGAHQVVPFGSNIKADLLKLQGSFCDAHPGNKVEIYCNSCHSNVCLTCHALKHREHDCKDITDIYKDFSAALALDVEQVKTKESSFLKEVSCFELALEQYNDKVQGIEKEVLDNANDLKRRIDEAVNAIMMKLVNCKTAAKKATSVVKTELEFAAAASQSFTRYSQELLSKGKPSDITRAYNNLRWRADELLKRNLKPGGCHLPEVGFWMNNLFDELADFIREKSTLKMIHTMKEDKPVDGLTILNGNLFVVGFNDTSIRVYDTEKFSLQRMIPVPDLGGACDMTSCKRHQCIYISDYIKEVIHKVDDTNKVTQWPVGDDPAGLSVNSVHNVLVTCNVVGKVKEFTTDGQLVREIVLDSSIVTPLHTVELTNGELVVCHGDDDDDMHRVCFVNSSGELLRSYGGSKGSGSGQLNEPTHLAVVNDVIFVADSSNHRVLMLSPTLSLIREVKFGQKDPCCMWYDDETNRLFIGGEKWQNDDDDDDDDDNEDEDEDEKDGDVEAEDAAEQDDLIQNDEEEIEDNDDVNATDGWISSAIKVYAL